MQEKGGRTAGGQRENPQENTMGTVFKLDFVNFWGDKTILSFIEKYIYKSANKVTEIKINYGWKVQIPTKQSN